MYQHMDDTSRWVFPQVLADMAGRLPDLSWIEDSHGDTMTFGQARSQAAQASAYFESLGVRHGERVGMLMLNSCAFVRVWLGLGNLGAIAVMFNTQLRGRFLQHQVVDSGVSCIVVDADLVPQLADLADELPAMSRLIIVGSDTAASPWPADLWHRYASSAEWQGPMPHASDTACVMYTSGTTGPSKGVLLPHAHCTLFSAGTIKSMQLTAADRYYINLPLFHANGLLMQLGATLLMGMSAFLRDRFTASNWLTDVRAHGSTVTNFLGATVNFVLAQPASPRDRDHHLRAAFIAPSLPQHEEQLHERFGITDVMSGFGMTECNIVAWGRLGRSVPGAGGWVHEDHFQVCIADPQTDTPVAPGQVGEILVRPKVPSGFMAGYLNQPDKTVEAWRNLWFHTGDAGFMDEDGLITFVDRIKDCIRRRGENISAWEIEAVVQGLPGIAEVAAFAVPSDVPGAEDEVMLAVVPNLGAPVDCDAIYRLASEQLPRFAAPRYIRVMAELPKTATGKVQRAVLRKEGSADALDMAAGRKEPAFVQV